MDGPAKRRCNLIFTFLNIFLKIFICQQPNFLKTRAGGDKTSWQRNIHSVSGVETGPIDAENVLDPRLYGGAVVIHVETTRETGIAIDRQWKGFDIQVYLMTCLWFLCRPNLCNENENTICVKFGRIFVVDLSTKTIFVQIYALERNHKLFSQKWSESHH